MRHPEPSPFVILERSFALLTTGPSPLALDGRAVGHGLPARPIPLDELRAVLLDRSMPHATRDAALTVLVRQAQARRGSALVGLAAVLLPGLREAAAPLLDACPERRHDVEAELLAGLMEAVAACAPERGRVAARLIWTATRAAYRVFQLEQRERPGLPSGELVGALARPAGHPDRVLAKAVAEGVITAADAALIGETRIGGVRLRELAARWGVGYDALRKRRQRAEGPLVAWLLDRGLSQNQP
jgi:hypothetical protein